ncbi:MAG: c-type cytochrome domain-containing protein [Flavobacteriales bacterium]
MKLKQKIGVIVFGILAILAACKHHPDTTVDIIPPDDNGGNGGGVNPIDTVTNPCSPDTVYFTNSVLPIILSHCSMPGCHNTATNDNDGIALTNYSQIMNYVEPGDLNSSELWDDAIAETDPDKIMPPLSSVALTSGEMETIQTWIMQGALNNSCAECDSTFTFSADIFPIIQQNCSGCHNATNPSGYLSLTNHAEIQAAALSLGLMDRLNGIGGIMPPNSNGISSCNKNRIQQWIDAGAPNN